MWIHWESDSAISGESDSFDTKCRNLEQEITGILETS